MILKIRERACIDDRIEISDPLREVGDLITKRRCDRELVPRKRLVLVDDRVTYRVVESMGFGAESEHRLAS